ncbi:hypothetical protein [Pandoraea terrigena]|uniref:Uncharacterized protein n=1 Tax=Pandoraea terrigena TaxID=2508292 RepID=A0A5E4RLY7_9BURK|nr:hypothetical protein [Pandoraea terrigena]VVD64317.1 hypothetical protein PTE31013_00268 [Pandoraea terrigena]
MPSIESASCLWRARLRTLMGRGRSGWVAWLIVALLGVQIWGLQHEIVHARGLSGSVPRVSADRAASAAVDAAESEDADDADLAIAADGPGQSMRVASIGFGSHHHHCHLFEGATLAAAMAVAVLSWGSDGATASAPQRPTGRRHASVLRRPFDSRAPPLVA